MDSNPVVAVFNTSPDTVDLLRIVLERAGVVVVAAFTYELRDGEVDIETFWRQHQPVAAVYDIALPYDANWRLFEHIRSLDVMRKTKFIVTTTNEKHVRAIAGPNEQLFEIVGKPYDLGLIVEAVKKAAGISLAPSPSGGRLEMAQHNNDKDQNNDRVEQSKGQGPQGQGKDKDQAQGQNRQAQGRGQTQGQNSKNDKRNN